MQGVTVTIEGIGVGIAAITAIVAVVNWTVSKTLEARLGPFREDMQRWINGSFMRSAEVNARLDGLNDRIEYIEVNGCAHRADHE